MQFFFVCEIDSVKIWFCGSIKRSTHVKETLLTETNHVVLESTAKRENDHQHRRNVKRENDRRHGSKTSVNWTITKWGKGSLCNFWRFTLSHPSFSFIPMKPKDCLITALQSSLLFSQFQHSLLWWVFQCFKIYCFLHFLISQTCKVSSHNPFEMKANKSRDRSWANLLPEKKDLFISFSSYSVKFLKESIDQ